MVRVRGKKNGKTKSTTADRTGVCYLSFIPPKMDFIKLRQLLSRYAQIDRIYLVPENPYARMNPKRPGRYYGTHFTEGWVEFVEKNEARRVASMLNCQRMGRRRRSPFYEVLWNIKYLRNFRWAGVQEELRNRRNRRRAHGKGPFHWK